jgi:hypothetical protein
MDLCARDARRHRSFDQDVHAQPAPAETALPAIVPENVTLRLLDGPTSPAAARGAGYGGSGGFGHWIVCYPLPSWQSANLTRFKPSLLSQK